MATLTDSEQELHFCSLPFLSPLTGFSGSPALEVPRAWPTTLWQPSFKHFKTFRIHAERENLGSGARHCDPLAV